MLLTHSRLATLTESRNVLLMLLTMSSMLWRVACAARMGHPRPKTTHYISYHNSDKFSNARFLTRNAQIPVGRIALQIVYNEHSLFWE
jgi:hypothetical protein